MAVYGEFLPFVRSELEQLELEGLHLSVGSILEALESSGSDSADAAVREYAATLIWPPLEDPVRFEICLRLRVAIWWLESVMDEDSEGDTLPEILESTMIDYWRDGGRADWVWNHLVNPDVVL